MSKQENTNIRKPDQVFPVRLFNLYVLLLVFVLFMIDGPLDPGSPYPEDYAEALANGMALAPALVIVFFLSLWNFRSMPVFAVLSSLAALGFLYEAWAGYWPDSFQDYPIDFRPLETWGLLFAIPFCCLYLLWFFWMKKSKPILPKVTT
jgi:hypothetical protein